MKKIITALMALGLIIPALSAQNQIFLMKATSTVGEPAPSEDDPSLILNEATGAYEGTVNLNKNAFKFYYTDSEGKMVTIGPEGLYSVVSFSSSDVFEDSCTEGSTGRWYVTYFPFAASTCDVAMTVNPKEGNVVFEALSAGPEIPTALYLWGSTDGGLTYTMDEAFELNEDGIFTLSTFIPECGPFIYDDPEFKPGDDAPDHGYYFILTTNGESISKGNSYGAPLNNKMFDLEEGEYSETLLYRSGASMVCLSSGDVLFLFNPKTLEFIAQAAPKPDVVKVTIVFSSDDIEEDIYTKVITTMEAFSGSFLDPAKPEVDSDVYTFTCIPAIGINFEPVDGYLLKSLVSDIETSDFENIQGGKYQRSVTLFPGAPSEVTLTLEVASENSRVESLNFDSSTLNITSIQGIRLNNVTDAERLNSLPKGLYIINGKKVFVK